MATQRHCVIFLNLRTNAKIVFTNRKLAHDLYEKICSAEEYPMLSYSRFSTKVVTEPIRFLDFEVSYSVLVNPLYNKIDDLYKNIISHEPAKVKRAKIIQADASQAIPMTFGKGQADQGAAQEATSDPQ